MSIRALILAGIPGYFHPQEPAFTKMLGIRAKLDWLFQPEVAKGHSTFRVSGGGIHLNGLLAGDALYKDLAARL